MLFLCYFSEAESTFVLIHTFFCCLRNKWLKCSAKVSQQLKSDTSRYCDILVFGKSFLVGEWAFAMLAFKSPESCPVLCSVFKAMWLCFQSSFSLVILVFWGREQSLLYKQILYQLIHFLLIWLLFRGQRRLDALWIEFSQFVFLLTKLFVTMAIQLLCATN